MCDDRGTWGGGGGEMRKRRWTAGTLAAAMEIVLGICGAGREASAYSAAGDRLFPATLTLPQITPADEFYLWSSTQPEANGSRVSTFSGVFAKTLTERLGVVVEESWIRLDRIRKKTWFGWLNLDAEIKYLAAIDREHEFLMTLGVEREFGGTGARRIGAFAAGSTTPRLYFGKGLGDLDIGYGRPLAVTGLVGYQIGDARPRPDLVTAGFTVEYSIPYLLSKVASVDLPEPFRNLTPLTEVSFTVPGAGRSFGARTTALIAPGVSYAGEGWELAIEALVPASRATGRGVGAIAQFHLSLDFLFPETIGRPLFP